MRHLICDEIGTPYFKDLMHHIEIHKDIDDDLYLDSKYYPNISTFFFTAGDIEKAFYFINKGISRYNNESSLVIEKCKMLILLRNYLTASTILENIDEEESPYILFERVKLAMLTKNPMEAKIMTEKILNTIENKESFFIQLTFFFIINHMKERAFECWKVASRHPQNTFDYRLAQVALLYELGKYKEAHKICRELYLRQPNNLVVLLYYGYTLFKRCQYNRVKKCIYHLKEIHPQNLDTLKLENSLKKILR